ncbi:MAG: hypothetical protein ACM3RX_02785 [Methanococcaceae archaeon]
MKIANYLLLLLCATFITVSCSKDNSSNDNNNNTTTPGPKFTEVKSIINTNCAVSGCHVNPTNPNGVNLQSNDNIVSHKAKIKEMAVDLDLMPPGNPLPDSDQAKITAWIEAGGRITD